MMEVLYGAGPDAVATMDTAALRREFLIADVFVPAEVRFTYTHVDRMIIGGAMPTGAALSFGDGKDIGTPYLLSARELGIANLGGAGKVNVDGTVFELAGRDVLYVGRGAKAISVSSDDPNKPAPNST